MNFADMITFLDDPSACEIVYHDHATDAQGMRNCYCTRTLTWIDESGLSGNPDSFYVAGFAFGPCYLIHASSFESAYDAWIDELPTIPEEELIEAYAHPDADGGSFLDWAIDRARNALERLPTDEWSKRVRKDAKAEMDRVSELASAGEADYPELIEGYHYQSNASGTGIVDLGHYEFLEEADLERIHVRRKEVTED